MASINELIAIPLGDDDIRKFLPDAMIIKYADLANYPTLHDVLPEVQSFCFILYEDSPNKGHWTLISRPEEGIAEYFDSYGGYVDDPLKWTDKEERAELGQSKQLLASLFRKTPDDVVFNRVKYQKQGPGINNCGRWCVLRTVMMKKGYNLEEFFDYVKKNAKNMKLGLDQFVTSLIC